LLNQQRGSAGTPSVSAVAPPEGVKKKLPPPAPENGSTQKQSLTSQNLPDIWDQTLRKLPGLLARSLEKGGLPAIIAPNNLVLRFPIEYNVAKEHCQEPSRSALVESTLRELTAEPWVLRLEGVSEKAFGSSAVRSERGVRSGAEIGDSQTPNIPLTAPARRTTREEAEKVPLVKRAIEALGASVQRVDEGFGVMPQVGTNADDAPMEDEP
jgi:hypothetical protein